MNKTRINFTDSGRFQYSPEQIANTLYNLASDFDAGDYDETKSETIHQLVTALEYIHGYAQNPSFNGHFLTLYNCLSAITETH